jgi:hypothetical protein
VTEIILHKSNRARSIGLFFVEQVPTIYRIYANRDNASGRGAFIFGSPPKRWGPIYKLQIRKLFLSPNQRQPDLANVLPSNPPAVAHRLNRRYAPRQSHLVPFKAESGSRYEANGMLVNPDFDTFLTSIPAFLP